MLPCMALCTKKSELKLLSRGKNCAVKTWNFFVQKGVRRRFKLRNSKYDKRVISPRIRYQLARRQDAHKDTRHFP